MEVIIPAPSSASISSAIGCLTEIFTRSTSIPFQTEGIRDIVSGVTQFIATPTSPLLTTMYIKLVTARAQKQGGAFLRETAQTWCNDIAGRDCYGISEIIVEWLAQILRLTSVDDCRNFIVQSIKSGLRFFAVLVAVLKFTKLLKEPAEVTQTFKTLSDCADQWPGAIAHRTALKLVSSRKKLAMDLARFDTDCPESDLIIAALAPPVKLTPLQPQAAPAPIPVMAVQLAEPPRSESNDVEEPSSVGSDCVMDLISFD
jgi:hypothetical protein